MKKILMMIISTLLILFMVGCNNQENEGDVFKYIGLKVYDPVYVAIENGYFKDIGLEVELVDTIAGGSTATQLVHGNNVQGGLLSIMAIINAVENGLDIIGVTDIQSATNQAPLENFYVRKDSNIKKAEDLKGKTIAVNLMNSSFHYTVLYYLEQNGIKENEVSFVEIPFSEQILSLENKRVDMIGLMVPYNGMARDNEDFELLFDAVDVFGEKQFTLHIVNTEYAAKYPEQIKLFVRGIVEATEWIMSNQESAKTIISKYTGIDAKYIDDYYFQDNAMVIEDDVEFWIDYMFGRNEVTKLLDVSSVATNKYNDGVLE